MYGVTGDTILIALWWGGMQLVRLLASM